MRQHLRLGRLFGYAALLVICVVQGQACSPHGFQASSSSKTSNITDSSGGGGSIVVPDPSGNGGLVELKAIDSYRIAHVREVMPAATSILNSARTTTLVNLTEA